MPSAFSNQMMATRNQSGQAEKGGAANAELPMFDASSALIYVSRVLFQILSLKEPSTPFQQANLLTL
jgi:hypothetical protein